MRRHHRSLKDPALNFTCGQWNLGLSSIWTVFERSMSSKVNSQIEIFDHILINVDCIKLCFNEPHNERYKMTEIAIHHLGWVVTTMIVTDAIRYLMVDGPYRIDWGPGKVLKKSLLCVGLGMWEPCSHLNAIQLHICVE